MRVSVKHMYVLEEAADDTGLTVQQVAVSYHYLFYEEEIVQARACQKHWISKDFSRYLSAGIGKMKWLVELIFNNAI